MSIIYTDHPHWFKNYGKKAPTPPVVTKFSNFSPIYRCHFPLTKPTEQGLVTTPIILCVYHCCSCQFRSTIPTEQGLVTTPIILCVYQCYLLMSFSFNQTNRVRTGNHSHHPLCISVLSIDVISIQPNEQSEDW